MTKKRQKEFSVFVIVWEFRCRKARRREFENAYSPDGIWARFFRVGEGYIRTELLCAGEDPLRYLTIDVWRSRKAYEQFKKQNRDEYQAIDRQCESLTEVEQKIGEFQAIETK
jgi:heme-degrading monooxygenase HmoA